jgi:hypothetical protein
MDEKKTPRAAPDRSPPAPWAGAPEDALGPTRRGLPFESLIQEAIRRAASLGFSSFFLTEEAVRKAFSEVVPKDWVDYVGKQGNEVRGELIDRLAGEFNRWLRSVDAARILGDLLENYKVSATIQLSATPREPGDDRTTAPGGKPKRKK